MPQLDTASFPSQLFWLLVCFLALYFILSYIALPKIARVLEKREETLMEKINKASTYRERAEDLLASYEKTLAEAREAAHQHSKTAMNLTLADIANTKKEFLEKLKDRLHLNEQELYRARLIASKDITALSGEIASAILLKLTGHTYPAAKLAKKKEKV